MLILSAFLISFSKDDRYQHRIDAVLVFLLVMIDHSP